MPREPVRVKLTCDLTRYDHRLVAGSLGWTVPAQRATWGVIVNYDCGARLDTLWKSLEDVPAAQSLNTAPPVPVDPKTVEN